MVEIRFEIDKNRAVAYNNEEEIGECVFLEQNNDWNIVHTGVDASYQGQGIARKLVENIIENAKKYHKRIMADCSYAKKVIDNKKD